MAAIKRLEGWWSLAFTGEGVFLAGLTSRRMEGQRLAARRGLQSLFGGVGREAAVGRPAAVWRVQQERRSK